MVCAERETVYRGRFASDWRNSVGEGIDQEECFAPQPACLMTRVASCARACKIAGSDYVLSPVCTGFRRLSEGSDVNDWKMQCVNRENHM